VEAPGDLVVDVIPVIDTEAGRSGEGGRGRGGWDRENGAERGGRYTEREPGGDVD
jgi:hypothetical protein